MGEWERRRTADQPCSYRGVLAFAGLIALIFTTGVDIMAATPLEKVASRYATLDGMRIHYKSIGSGSHAAVFVHGWTCDMSSWRFQVPALDGRIRVILIDLPGHGLSDKPEITYTMNLFARSIAAVIRDAGVDEAVLIGHSMGTPVIRQFYRLFPKRTRALVAVDGALRPYMTDPAAIEKFMAVFEGPGYKDAIAGMLDHMIPATLPAELRDSIRTPMLSAPPHVVAGAMRSMYEPAIWKEDTINVPLQVILARSPFWTEDYESFVRKLAPQVDYNVMDEVGHFLMLEKPDELNRLLAGFLGKLGMLKP
ncbi:MAG: alpha/beta hydrolase [Acidobacteria bacterium]|nr:alpha/beta hydrolase [Acidobacteriota bacterium]